MKNVQISRDQDSLIGQQLCSVLITIDYLTLKFAKYPLAMDGKFLDSVLVDIEEGFEIIRGVDTTIVRKAEDLDAFRRGSAGLVELIGRYVTSSKYSQNGELELQFDNLAYVRLLLNNQGFDSFDLTFQN
jgi:hypothetical protein